MSNTVPGTRGYEEVAESFIEVSQRLDFFEICSEFLDYLPPPPAWVLDAGSGAGQNAAALARMGYSVVAVEPLAEFLNASRKAYGGLGITWLQDSLPQLWTLTDSFERFDFILLEGVWHHLDEDERACCLARLSGLLRLGGVCAISLRNGPAGAGRHVYPTDDATTVADARRCGLAVAFHRANLPSKMANKPGVIWSRFVLKKVSTGSD